MKKFLGKMSVVSVGLLTPVFAFAEGVDTSGLLVLINKFQQLIAAVIPLLIGLALLAFLYGVLMYLFGKQKDEAKDFMIWGIIALFVMTSVWGLVSILRSTILPNSASNQLRAGDIPTVPTYR
jgi:apolipoprotein N-acyltransferase